MATGKFFEVYFIDTHSGKAHKKIVITGYLDELYRFVKTGQLSKLSITPTTQEKADEYVKNKLQKIGKKYRIKKMPVDNAAKKLILQ